MLTKLAPNKVTRKHEPALVTLFANISTKLIKKPKFHVCDYVRVAKLTYLSEKITSRTLHIMFLK